MLYFQAIHSFFTGRNCRDPRDGCQVQLVILSQDMIGKLALAFNTVCIIQTGYQQDLFHLKRHQVMEDIPVCIMLIQE